MHLSQKGSKVTDGNLKFRSKNINLKFPENINLKFPENINLKFCEESC